MIRTYSQFISLVEKDINDAKNEPKKRPKQNLTKGELEALKQLEKRQDIIISNADKGGAVVIMDTDKFIEEADCQLSDSTNYKKLQKDPTLQNNKLVNDTTTRFKKEKLLPQNIADGLNTSNPRTPKFYLSPKIHKPNNPGRPVISSVDCHTSNISRCVDYHLQPIVKNIPSYIKDTNDFIKKTKDLKVPKDAILVSLDVKALYTSIPNSEGIAAVKKAYDKYQQKTVATKVLTTFLALILTLNNFIFNCKLYLQIKGCEMGTICAPAYENIFMAYFEEKFIYPLADAKTLLYLRFIDDIFMIWTKSEKDLIIFLDELNTKHTSIKFEFKYSRQQIKFLDTLVYIDNNNKLQTTLYKKSTDRQNYLHSKSEDPYSLKKSIAYSQALRIKRMCSTQNEFEKHSSNLLQQRKKKGYHHDTLKKQIEKARVQERTLLLNKNPEEVKQSIPISITYNRTLPNIKSIVDKHWHVLQVNPELKERFQSSPIIAFRKNKNLKQIVGSNTIEHHKKLIRSNNGKSSPCLSNTRTLCCKQVVSTTSFKSNQTNRVFKIFHNINCESIFSIYLLECNICNIQYVGKSETTFKHPFE